MPTCESTTFADVVLMVIQFAALGIALLILMGFIQRAFKALVNAGWNWLRRLFKIAKGEA
ncbi:hypothetical protein [Azonexus sp.]|jgi:hypothetical protein|uniref:hypothetical protein n=1 Tax=Azonexus sp. TaxID=1872668 RepID=UPI00283071D7|nr:hypothetical protein [Azonexus sp.]MDR1994039.1 hypothetical protein [Azonexus sp.]